MGEASLTPAEARERVTALVGAIADLEREVTKQVPAALREALTAGDHEAVAEVRDRAEYLAAELASRRLELGRARLEELDAQIAADETAQAERAAAAAALHEERAQAEEAARAAQSRFEELDRRHYDARLGVMNGTDALGRLRQTRHAMARELDAQIETAAAAA